MNVVTQKSVSSIATSGGAFKFVTFDELLEFEAGTAANEPSHLAVQAAIEKAVYALILEGARPNRQLWAFQDPAAGQAWLTRYDQDRRRSMGAVLRRGGGPPGPANDPANR
jgi:curli production assembly/transport component CsgG